MSNPASPARRGWYACHSSYRRGYGGYHYGYYRRY